MAKRITKKQALINAFLVGNDAWDDLDEQNAQAAIAAQQAELVMAEAERILQEERAAAQAEQEAAKQDAKLCLCGCGGTPVGKTARFIPGHDGRLKGRLLAEARGDVPEIAAAAVHKLNKFGWSHFLVERVKDKKKRQAAERRAEKAAAEAKAEGKEAEPAASALTAEDRARIAAIRQARSMNGFRDLTTRNQSVEIVA